MKPSSRFPIRRALLCSALALLATPRPAHAVTFDTSSGDITQSAAITDGVLTKTGTGTLTLTTANAFTGEVAVNDGTLAIDHADALTGATPVTVNAHLAIAPAPLAQSSVGGSVFVGYSGSTLAGVFIPSDLYTVTSATTLTSVANPTQTYSLAGSPATNGVLTLNTTVSGLDAVKVFGGTINGAGSLAANSLFIRNGTVSAAIARATRVVIGEESTNMIFVPSSDVGGPAVLSGNNTYTGGTSVYSGTLEARSANALGSGDITVRGTGGTATPNVLSIPVSFAYPPPSEMSGSSTSSGSSSSSASETLHLSGSNTYTGTTTVSAGAISGAGSLTKIDSGTINLGGGTLTLALDTIIISGSAPSALGTTTGLFPSANTGTRMIPNSGTLNLSAEMTTPGKLTLDGGSITGTGSLNASAFDVRAGDVTAKLTGPGALTKSGAGTVWLTGANDYSGGTTVQAGRLDVSAAGALNGGPVSVTDGLLIVSAAQNLTRLDTSATGQLGIDAGETQIHGGALAGNIVVASGATLTLDGTARIAQPENGHPGNLVYSPYGAEMLGTSVLLVNGTINLNGGTHQLGLIEGGGTIHVRGDSSFAAVDSKYFTGTWIIDGSATVRGNTTFHGSFTNNGRVAPGNSPGVITVVGDFVNGPAGIVDIEIAGTTPGTGHDVIRYSGSAIINGGTLNLTFIGGYTPTGPVAIRFLQDTDLAAGSPSASGAFSVINMPAGYYAKVAADNLGMTATLATSLSGLGVALHKGLAGADAGAAQSAQLTSAITSTLATRGASAAADALQALSPIGLTAMPALALDAANSETRAITGRADAHRRLIADNATHWETFAGYTGRLADTEGGESSPVFDSSVQQGRVGLEKAATRTVVIGVAPSYTHGKATLTAGSGDVTLERAGLTAYSAFVAGETVAQLGVRGGYLDYETRRKHALGADTGATNGYDLGAFTSVSHVFTLGNFAITPETSLGYTHTKISGFRESATGAALAVNGGGYDSLRARLGAAFDWTPLRSAGSALAIGLAVGAEHELLDHDGEIVAAYAGGSRFTTESALNAETAVDIGPQLTWLFSGNNTVRAGYRYEYGFDDTTAHRVDVSYSKRF